MSDVKGPALAAGCDPAVPRDRWESRATFILAGVGAAVGLGNIWRFPFLNYRHGGGAFLIPYVIALLFTGLPLLQAELALGRLFQKGDVMSFGGIHKRARGVGAISAVGGFAIVTYYSSIIAWAVYFTAASFEWPFRWAVNCAEDDAECLADPARALPIESAVTFFDDVLGTNDDSLQDGVARRISGPLLLTLLITWVFTYFCIWKGVRSVGAAVKITVILPWTLLAILIIYNATLEGSGDGVRAYIGVWDMSVLQDGTAWSDAAGQIFLSLGATLGIMSAYGSYAPTTTNIYTDNTLIAYINCLTSLVSGFAVFSILGNMASRTTAEAAGNPDLRLNICDLKVDDDTVEECMAGFDCSLCGTEDWEMGGQCCGKVVTNNVARGGVYLAFAVYPATMQYVGRGGANILSIFWFLTLWLLGIDSMFAMVEGVATVITDTPRFCHLRREKVALVTCILGFLASIVFVSDIGFVLLDVFDHYILGFALMLTGALEAYVVAWVWAWPELRYRCGRTSAMLFMGSFTVGSIVLAVLAGALHHFVGETINLAIALPLGAGIFLLGTIAAFFARERSSQSLSDWLNVASFSGTRNLRSTFTPVPTRMQTVAFILTFDVPVKYVCFPALLGLFVNQAIQDERDNGYGGYPIWTHALTGAVIMGTMAVALGIFVVYPGFWDAIGSSKEKLDEDIDEHSRVTRLVEQSKAMDNRIADESGSGVPVGSILNDKTFLPVFEQTGDDWGNVDRPA